MDETRLPPLRPGTLYVVATPIGNLEDITLRALRVLMQCDLVAAEDTRRSALLLRMFGVRKPLLSCFKFNEAARAGGLVEQLRQGRKIALLTDAGTPGISDPGARVVRMALEAGCRVEPVPGPCALAAALSASGLDSSEFHFLGFLPHKPGARRRQLEAAGNVPGVLVLYESPYRIVRLLSELVDLYPDRNVVLARELTKKFEEFKSGSPAQLLEEASKHPPKGEFVVLVSKAPMAQKPEGAIF